MYHQSSTSSYKYVSLDLSHLNKKKKIARQSLQQSRDYYSYGEDFNIQNSWVHGGGGGGGRIDTLKESMLSYTKRMSDIRRIRGINALSHSQPAESKPALWINTGKGSLHFDMVEDNHARSKYYASHNRMTKSLGTIKLEPLLGSRKVSANIDIDSTTSLQTHKMEKESRLTAIVTQNEEEPVKVKHITVTISIPPAETQDDEEDLPHPPQPSPDMPISALVAAQLPKKKLTPLGGGRPRPRKAKRMKIIEPTLESIDEDMDEASVAHTQVMEEGYNDLLNEVHNSHELMLEQKRKTVALLRQTNYAQRSHQQNRQITMASLAKRKMKRLPPIPTGRPPSLRYTNNKGGASTSPYTEDRAENEN